jgi:hypothetical protein
MKARWIKKILKVAAIAAVAVTVFGFLVMTLWNWLAPEVFGFHTVTFWQALGILILSKILFGGFHGKRGWGGPWRYDESSGRWRRLTAEEREKFRQGMLTRCGRAGAERI